ncbi:MAG: amidohydrolase family protein, partial [Candidatus Eisenbacteria bacterium]|nr:amidohydrolase family protein [Candidatus Eisenbacteria bacterium]
MNRAARRIVIENGVVFTGDAVLSGGPVVIEDGRLAAVGSASARPGDAAGTTGAPPDRGETPSVDAPPKPADVTRLDAGGRLVTPGLVNAHTHIYSALARGIALKDAPPRKFDEILGRLWWRLDRALTLEEIALSAKLHGWECLRAGVTAIFDHHSSQTAIRGSLATIATALEELGLRAVLAFEVSDRDGPEAVRQGIAENVAFMQEMRDSAMRRG